MLAKFFWGLQSGGFLLCGLLLSVHYLIDVQGDRLKAHFEHSQPSVGTAATPAPVVTLCPVQLYDRWNLQKALLNRVDMFIP